MTEKFFRKFLKTAFVGIILDDDNIEITIQVFKNKTKLFSETKNFQIQNSVYPTILLNYLEQIYANNQYVYVGTMLTSINQGALPECAKDGFAKYQVESRNTKTICINGKWLIYSGKNDIDAAEKLYDKLGGLDYIFSPVSILNRFFSKDIADEAIMCALKLKSFLCVAVFDKNRLLYSSLMQINTGHSDTKTTSADTSESTFEDFFDDDEVHELDGDGMVDLDELSVSLDDDTMQSPALSSNIEDEAFKNGGADNLINLESAGNDLRLADFIKESIGEFYKNPAYESSFIEKIYIADPTTSESDTKIILENELMMGVDVRLIPLSQLLCDMSMEESQ